MVVLGGVQGGTSGLGDVNVNACGLEEVRDGQGRHIGSQVRPGVLNLLDGQVQVLILV